MPVMTGYEATRAIRRVESERRECHAMAGTLSEHRPALIIALTGFSTQKDQEIAFDSGVDIFSMYSFSLHNSWIFFKAQFKRLILFQDTHPVFLIPSSDKTSALQRGGKDFR
jgi:hypothetical protein